MAHAGAARYQKDQWLYLIHTDGVHPVQVEKMSGSAPYPSFVRVFDPADGRRFMSRPTTLLRDQGLALELFAAAEQLWEKVKAGDQTEITRARAEVVRLNRVAISASGYLPSVADHSESHLWPIPLG